MYGHTTVRSSVHLPMDIRLFPGVNKVAAYTTSSSLEVESAGSGRNLEVSQTVRKGWAVAYAISAQQNPGPGFLQGAEKPPVVAKASSRRVGISSAVWASSPV